MSAAALLGQRQSSLLERSDMTPEEMAEAKGKAKDLSSTHFLLQCTYTAKSLKLS